MIDFLFTPNKLWFISIPQSKFLASFLFGDDTVEEDSHESRNLDMNRKTIIKDIKEIKRTDLESIQMYEIIQRTLK